MQEGNFINKIKITLFIPNLGGGGAERVICNLANFIVLNKDLSAEILLMNADFPIKYYVHPSVTIKYLNCSRTLFSLPKLVFYLKNNRQNIFLSSLTHANIVSIVAGLIVGSLDKIFVSEHALFDLTLDASLKDRVIRFLVKVLYPKANKVIAVSDIVKERLIEISQISPDKILRIYNPLVLMQDEKKSFENPKHKVMGLGKASVIISAGRFCSEKDFITLLKAMKIVISTKNQAKLILLGDGPDRELIFNTVNLLGLSEHVEMPGFSSDIHSCLVGSDLFVLSSPRESFGNVLIEAMALNIPVISTDCGGPREILENGLWGALVPIGDYRAMADAIIKSLDSNNILNTKDRVKEFSISKQANEYLALFFGALDGGLSK